MIDRTRLSLAVAGLGLALGWAASARTPCMLFPDVVREAPTIVYAEVRLVPSFAQRELELHVLHTLRGGQLDGRQIVVELDATTVVPLISMLQWGGKRWIFVIDRANHAILVGRTMRTDPSLYEFYALFHVMLDCRSKADVAPFFRSKPVDTGDEWPENRVVVDKEQFEAFVRDCLQVDLQIGGQRDHVSMPEAREAHIRLRNPGKRPVLLSLGTEQMPSLKCSLRCVFLYDMNACCRMPGQPQCDDVRIGARRWLPMGESLVFDCPVNLVPALLKQSGVDGETGRLEIAAGQSIDIAVDVGPTLDSLRSNHGLETDFGISATVRIAPVRAVQSTFSPPLPGVIESNAIEIRFPEWRKDPGSQIPLTGFEEPKVNK